MDLVLSQIEDIYHSYNVYKSVVVYSNTNIDLFKDLKDMMLDRDFSFGEAGRIGSVLVREGGGWEEVDAVVWDMVNLVVCLDEDALSWARRAVPGLVTDHRTEQENILMVKI